MINKKTSIVLSLSIFSSFLSANQLILDKNSKEFKLIQSHELLRDNHIKVKKVLKTDSIFLVQGDRENNQPVRFYSTLDGKTIITGTAFDKKKKVISMPINMKELKNIVSFSIGKGNREFFIFTDPDCPYCKKLENLIESNKLLKKAKFNFILLPLPMHPNAKEKSIYISSFKSDKDKYKALSNSNTIPYENKAYTNKERDNIISKLNNIEKFAKNNNISGTPTVLDVKGENVNWTNLPTILK